MNLYFFFNHFILSKALKPLRCKRLPSVREQEKNNEQKIVLNFEYLGNMNKALTTYQPTIIFFFIIFSAKIGGRNLRDQILCNQLLKIFPLSYLDNFTTIFKKEVQDIYPRQFILQIMLNRFTNVSLCNEFRKQSLVLQPVTLFLVERCHKNNLCQERFANNNEVTLYKSIHLKFFKNYILVSFPETSF